MNVYVCTYMIMHTSVHKNSLFIKAREYLEHLAPQVTISSKRVLLQHSECISVESRFGPYFTANYFKSTNYKAESDTSLFVLFFIYGTGKA